MRVIVNFQERKGWSVQTLAEDCRTCLGPYVPVASLETLLRLLRYLGATDSEMRDVEQQIKQWNKSGGMDFAGFRRAIQDVLLVQVQGA